MVDGTGGSLPKVLHFASALAISEPPEQGERASLVEQQPLWFLSMEV
jgi:hypothetical protein